MDNFSTVYIAKRLAQLCEPWPDCYFGQFIVFISNFSYTFVKISIICIVHHYAQEVFMNEIFVISYDIWVVKTSQNFNFIIQNFTIG